MASHLRLIRPAGTLAAKGHSTQLLFSSSNLRLSVANGCTVTHQEGPDKAFSLLAKRAFSTSLASNSNQSSSGSKDAAAAEKTKAAAVSASEVAEEGAKKKVVAEAEKKRIEAQDAALKEILESAAAEKRKLEQEAIKVAEEKARLKAAQEAEAAAAEARTAAAAAAKAKADAAARAKLDAERQAAASAGKSSQPQKQQEHKQEQYQTSWSHSQSTGFSEAAASNPTATSSNKSFATDSLRVGAGMSASSASSQQAPPSTTTKGQAKDVGSYNPLREDPLEPFKAKLLPYKRSLESSTEYIRSALPDSLRQLSESMKRKDYHDTIALLAGHLNTFTGYNAINELKYKVITHGDRLDQARIKLVQAKQAYEDAIGMRSDTQKAINDLLQRKHLWSPDDVIRFTDLYRSEHANEQAEQKTKAQYKQAESEVEDRSRQLTTVITERYHEEQVWSDKIRAASTYGTWGLIGVNVMAFLIVQAFVEPRRRRKQVERYEELVQDLTERGILPNQLVSASTGGGMVSAVVAAPAVTAQEPAGDGSEAVDTDATPVAVGGALLGGEDVLLKIIQSAERQEERLDRMEILLLKQIPDAQVNANVDKAGSAGNFVVADDGSILFMPEEHDDQNNGPESVAMAKAWREEIQLGSRSGGLSELNTLQPGGSRLSRVLKDGGAEVPATRRDFLLSGLGGAIIGGLVTVVVMMNC